MTLDAGGRSGSVLDPVDRSSEVLFGLIMALTFTTTLEVANAGRADVRTMLVGALGCNLAWGVVDGVMFVVTRSLEKHRFHSRIRAVQEAAPAEAQRILEEDLPDGWSLILDRSDTEHMTRKARALALPAPPRITVLDLRDGLAVFLLVFLSTLPVALPFLVFPDVHRALRVSNAAGIAMLFVIGARLGRHVGRPPLLVGLVMLAIGTVLSAIAIRLGG